MAEPDFEIVRVVGRRHLEGAGAESRVDVLVGYQWKAAGRQREDDGLANEMTVAVVLGVDGHGRVAKHGLGPGRGDSNVAGAVGQGVPDVVEVAGDLVVVHLQVA